MPFSAPVAVPKGAPVTTIDEPDAAGRPTLEVVAARAGVSRATASRVLRGATNVSEQARTAVLQAAGELSYSVNRAARSLVTRRSDSIAFLVAENEDRFFRDPYFLGILRGAQAEVAAAGLQLMFAVASTRAEVAQFETYAVGGHVDGVLLVSLHGNDHLPQHLEHQGVPTVLNGRPMAHHSRLYYVDADNHAGGLRATQALIDAGRRRIATITGPIDMCAGQDRLAGYREALEAAGLPFDEQLVAHGDFSVEGGARAMAQLLDACPDIDGVFAASDLTALGAIDLLAARGIEVPARTAVVGFDDVREASLSRPPLTTVRQPIEQLGRTMARVLLDRLGGRPTERGTVLPIELVQRASA
jgi:DNA-binding LacI/PurR family transcriptional regulator